jgi:hypothetical protein
MGTGAFNTTLSKSLNVFLSDVWEKLPPVGLSEYWHNIIQTDPNLTDVYMTLDIVFGGQKRLFISSVPISTTSSSTGNVYNYLPLMQEEPALDGSYSIGTASPSQRTISISLDGRLIEPSKIVSNGTSIAGICEISLQKLNGDYDNRLVIMRGDMTGGASYGSDEEVISTTIVDPAFTIDSIIPKHICSKETIPTVPDSFVGHRYPLIFEDYYGVPCIRTSDYMYSPTFVVCAGHNHIVSAVYINGNKKLSNDPDRGWGFGQGYDAKGNPVLVLKFVPTTIPWEDGDSVYADVEKQGEYPKTLMDIIKDILIRGSMLTEAGFDAQLFGKAETKLNPVQIRCLINGSGQNDTATAFSYIESTIGSSFPMISWTFTGRGYGPIVTDRRDDIIIMDLTARQGFLYDRESDITESSKTDIKNTFTLKYNYDSINDNYKSIIVRDDTNSPLCKLSQEKYGKYEGEVLESVVIYDDRVAEYVINWLVSHYTLPHYYIEYSASPALLFLLGLGDNVRLTDSNINISNAKATVTKIQYQKGQVIVGFQLWLLYENIGSSLSMGSGIYRDKVLEEEGDPEEVLDNEGVSFTFNVDTWVAPDGTPPVLSSDASDALNQATKELNESLKIPYSDGFLGTVARWWDGDWT